MLFHVLSGLTIWGFLSCSASAEDSQCVSFFFKNITDEIQSSIVATLLNNAKSLLDEGKKYATIKPSASAVDSQCASLFLKNKTDEIQSSIVVTILDNAKSLLEKVEKYITIKTRCSVVQTVSDRPVDCAEVKEKYASAQSGVYKIWPRNRMISGPVEVYCDMQDDGGAWTVLQRRGDFGSENDYFYKDWQSYKEGFGDPSKDFWIGNDNIFALTNQRSNVVKFTLTDWEDNQAYATYDTFWIDDEFHNYTLHVSGYNGTAGDSFSYNNEQSFSTKDRDNDQVGFSCAVKYKGAWWYRSCYLTNLNGLHLKGADKSETGVIWREFKGIYYSLKDTAIKIRPRDFRKKIDHITPL